MSYLRPWLAQPFLVSLYFVLSLAAANAVALHGAKELLSPAALVLASCAICLGIAWMWSRDAAKAALLAALWMTAFSTYGYVSELILPETSNVPGGEATLLVILALV